jgi:hypothetical protein
MRTGHEVANRLGKPPFNWAIGPHVVDYARRHAREFFIRARGEGKLSSWTPEDRRALANEIKSAVGPGFAVVHGKLSRHAKKTWRPRSVTHRPTTSSPIAHQRHRLGKAPRRVLAQKLGLREAAATREACRHSKPRRS